MASGLLGNVLVDLFSGLGGAISGVGNAVGNVGNSLFGAEGTTPQVDTSQVASAATAPDVTTPNVATSTVTPTVTNTNVTTPNPQSVTDNNASDKTSSLFGMKNYKDIANLYFNYKGLQYLNKQMDMMDFNKKASTVAYNNAIKEKHNDDERKKSLRMANRGLDYTPQYDRNYGTL